MQFGSAPFGLILLGLTLGMRHATDPDHVIAVTAILSRERRFFSALRIGLVWGLGHSATVLAVGTAIIFLKLKVPVRLGLSLEFAVAIVLILLGLRAARQTLPIAARWLWLGSKKASLVWQAGTLAVLKEGVQRAAWQAGASTGPDEELIVHSHSHTHGGGGQSHSHRHVHAHDIPHDEDLAAHHHLISNNLAEKMVGRSMAQSFVVGLVHGLAGSAAIALLVTAAIPSPWWATLYMAVFCGGVIIGMIMITSAVGAPFVFAAQRLEAFHDKLSMAAGWLSFGFGLFLACHIGIADQLFGPTPVWFPH